LNHRKLGGKQAHHATPVLVSMFLQLRLVCVSVNLSTGHRIGDHRRLISTCGSGWTLLITFYLTGCVLRQR